MTVRGLLSISSLTMLFMSIVFLLFPEYVTFIEISDHSEKEKLITIVNKQIISGIFLFVGILLLVVHKMLPVLQEEFYLVHQLVFLLLFQSK